MTEPEQKDREAARLVLEIIAKGLVIFSIPAAVLFWLLY
jgi:hypothetical protein